MLSKYAWAALAAGLASSLPTALWAQTSNGEENTIVVTATSAEQTQRFVNEVTSVPGAADLLARWDRSVCVSVAGAPQRQGQFIADQIARRAAAVGLTPGAPGCQANISIIITGESNAVAQRLYEQDRGLFGHLSGGNASTMDRAALDAFLNQPRAVRWWYLAETVGADGISLDGDTSIGGLSNAPVARSAGSRLRSDTRMDLRRVIVIVDASRVGGASIAALSDYIALVSLAQVNPNASIGAFPSILNLFERAEGAGAASFTDWDQAFLQSVYAATRNAANLQQQQREIARRMTGA